MDDAIELLACVRTMLDFASKDILSRLNLPQLFEGVSITVMSPDMAFVNRMPCDLLAKYIN